MLMEAVNEMVDELAELHATGQPEELAPVGIPPNVATGREEHATDELFASSPAASLQFLRPMIAFGVFYSLTVIPLILCVLGRTWAAPVCSQLRSWVLMHLLMQSVQLPFRLLLHRDLRVVATLQDELAARRLLQLSRSPLWYGNRALGFLNCIWFVIGAVWLWSGQECAASAPGLHLLSVGMFTVNPVRYMRGAPDALVKALPTFAYSRAHAAAAAMGAAVDAAATSASCAVAEAVAGQSHADGSGSQQQHGGVALASPGDACASENQHGVCAREALLQQSSLSEEGVVIGVAHTTCVICLQDYELGEQLTVLPCAHTFHCACIGKWLQRAKTCPLCQRALSEEAGSKPARPSEPGSRPAGYGPTGGHDGLSFSELRRRHAIDGSSH
ncbi:hypothetical protein T492DRAFT_1026127 [Pavlovales sp. CCMP2436]|nr:hypothetical protein T492DRAFT_1026127 [Pavlovales sp. CCMP2436]